MCSAYSVGIFMFSHRFHGSAQMVRVCRFSHGIHGSHRITCCEESPTESTESTELLAVKNLPRNSRDPQKLGCAIGCVGLTGMPYPPNLCASVPICGRHISARRFCVFCVFCGNTLSACSVGAAETAAPPAGFRPPPDQIPSAARSDSVRRPIRFRSPSNQIPSAIRRLGVRK